MRSALSSRNAFTLIEVMIVMTIVVAVLAIAWPRMRRMAAKTQIREAAIEFKAACNEARVHAARSGKPTYVRYKFGQSKFQLSDSIATDTQSTKWSEEYELALGTVFDDPQNQHRESEQITFFPEGRSTSAVVRVLASDNGDSIMLTIRGLTAGVTVGDVEKQTMQPDVDRTSDEAMELPPSSVPQGGRAGLRHPPLGGRVAFVGRNKPCAVPATMDRLKRRSAGTARSLFRPTSLLGDGVHTSACQRFPPGLPRSGPATVSYLRTFPRTEETPTCEPPPKAVVRRWEFPAGHCFVLVASSCRSRRGKPDGSERCAEHPRDIQMSRS